MVNLEGKICPLCQNPFTAAEEVVVCSACRMPLHRDCWNYLGGCSTPGCEGHLIRVRRKAPKPAPAPPLPPPVAEAPKVPPPAARTIICPYCLSRILPHENPVQCPACGQLHHRWCWEVNRGCTTINCSGTADVSPPPDDDFEITLGPSRPLPRRPSPGIPVAPPVKPAPPERTIICPYCQSRIHPSEQTVQCAACGQIHHRACWETNRGCTTYNCRSAVAVPTQAGGVRPPAPPPESVDISLGPARTNQSVPAAGSQDSKWQAQLPWLIMIVVMILVLTLGSAG